VGGGVEGDWEWKSRWKIRDLLADGRCSQAVLDFLSTTDVGRQLPAEEDVRTGVSEWELRERREREEERRAEAEELGAAEEWALEELPLFLPTPSFMASADEDQGGGILFLLFFLMFGLISCANSLVRSHFLGQLQPLRGQQTGNGLYMPSP